MPFSVIDVAVATALLWLGWHGFRRRLTGSLAWVAVALVTPYAAGVLTPHLVTWIAADVPDIPAFLREPAAGALALAAAGLASCVVATILFRQLQGVLEHLPAGFSFADRALGTFAAVTIGLVVLGAVTITISGLLSGQQRAQLASSFWGSRVVSQLPPLVPYAMAMRQLCPDGAPLGIGPSLPGGLSEPVSLTPEGMEAIRLILPALQSGAALELQGVPAGTAEEATQMLRDLSSGSATQAAPPGSIDATRLVLAALAADRPAGGESVGGPSDGTGEAARLLMSVLTGSPCAPALALAR